jgi:predicted O-methyltransferase YrrM
MNLDAFISAFEQTFPEPMRSQPGSRSQDFTDPCPEVVGMASVKKLHLLNLAASFLPQDGSECYLEVGTYQGKSLICALHRNYHCLAVACNNFSLFTPSPEISISILKNNLSQFGLLNQVKFYEQDFLKLFDLWNFENLPPIGFYFYDGAHDELSQYEGIKKAEPFLADQALVVVDDWRFAPDSMSYAEVGTKKAIEESPYNWQIRYVLPAKFNGDLELWWNGLAVLTFQR